VKETIGRDIVHRWKGNPAITIDDLSFRCNDIYNAGAVKFEDQYILLLTIQSLQGFYAVYAARSSDGYRFAVDNQPLMSRCKEGPLAKYESQGVLDARISLLGDTYYISYDALGDHGYVLGLATTSDFQTVRRVGLMSQPDTKGGVLFSRKIKGKYARLERPWAGCSIWVTYSDDLEFWGWSEIVMTPRGGFWDCTRIGVGAPPIETAHGWLLIYYGVKQNSSGPLFRLGAVVLDYDEPTRIIGRTNVPILSPRERYERIGELPNVVFCCGCVVEDDNKVKIYYGASNSSICVGTSKLDTIVDACMQGDQEF